MALFGVVMKPIWQEIEKENSWLKTEYYDFDENKEMVEKYEIKDILPVSIFLDKSGKEFLRLEGEIGNDFTHYRKWKKGKNKNNSRKNKFAIFRRGAEKKHLRN